MLRIADGEEDEWEVVKCYLSGNLASDSEDEKQLFRARREAAANKIKRNSFGMPPPPPPFSEKIPKSLTNHIKDAVAVATIQNLKESVLLVDKKDIFNISAQIEETETKVDSDRDWEISDKAEEISVRRRLKENIRF